MKSVEKASYASASSSEKGKPTKEEFNMDPDSVCGSVSHVSPSVSFISKLWGEG